jgi:hypothetical protein
MNEFISAGLYRKNRDTFDFDFWSDHLRYFKLKLSERIQSFFENKKEIKTEEIMVPVAPQFKEYNNGRKRRYIPRIPKTFEI